MYESTLDRPVQVKEPKFGEEADDLGLFGSLSILIAGNSAARNILSMNFIPLIDRVVQIRVRIMIFIHWKVAGAMRSRRNLDLRTP